MFFQFYGPGMYRITYLEEQSGWTLSHSTEAYVRSSEDLDDVLSMFKIVTAVTKLRDMK